MKGGINFYRYVDSNPIRFVDPSGLLDPCGSKVFGKTIYTPQDYGAMKAGVEEGLKLKFPDRAPEELDLAARQLTHEMSPFEARDIAKMREEGNFEGIEKKLEEIWNKIQRRKKEDQAKKDREREEKEKKCQK